jgi:hypothetical protein
MSVSLGWATLDLGVSIAASAIVALMVLAGGMALEAMPSDASEASASSRANQQNPVMICRDGRDGPQCVAEDS